MESSNIKALHRKKKRVIRIRKKIAGTEDRPRLCVTKTNKQLFVQFIDDVNGKTMVSMSSLNKELKGSSLNKESAKKLGSLIASKCNETGIKKAILDRRGNRYHGQIAALAEELRNNGVQI